MSGTCFFKFESPSSSHSREQLKSGITSSHSLKIVVSLCELHSCSVSVTGPLFETSFILIVHLSVSAVKEWVSRFVLLSVSHACRMLDISCCSEIREVAVSLPASSTSQTQRWTQPYPSQHERSPSIVQAFRASPPLLEARGTTRSRLCLPAGHVSVCTGWFMFEWFRWTVPLTSAGTEETVRAQKGEAGLGFEFHLLLSLCSWGGRA